MSKFRARSCPKCDYYMGFAISKPSTWSSKIPVANFCLNCNYKLPVHSIVRGVRRLTRPVRRPPLKLIYEAAQVTAPGPFRPARAKEMEARISPADYSRHLRAIGQDLENLHLTAFNLECVENSYLVWVRPDDQADSSNPLFRISRNRLQKLWRNKIQPRVVGHEESYALAATQTGRRLRYSIPELDRIEREQRARRREPTGTADGHSLSQLLRTIGDLIGRKGERLLGISWQELSVSMVVETPQGRKEIDVFRPDNLYDFWVRMYLRRDNRALSDTPR